MSDDDQQKRERNCPTEEELAQMVDPSDNLTSEMLAAAAIADLVLKSGCKLSARSDGSSTREIPPWFRSDYENT